MEGKVLFPSNTTHTYTQLQAAGPRVVTKARSHSIRKVWKPLPLPPPPPTWLEAGTSRAQGSSDQSSGLTRCSKTGLLSCRCASAGHPLTLGPHALGSHMPTWACKRGVWSQPRSGHTEAHTWVPGLSPRLGRAVPAHTTSIPAAWLCTYPSPVGECSGVCVPCTCTSARVPAAPFQSYQAPAQSFLSPVLQEKNLRDVVGKKNLTTSPSPSQALLSFSRPVCGGKSQLWPHSADLQS